MSEDSHSRKLQTCVYGRRGHQMGCLSSRYEGHRGSRGKCNDASKLTVPLATRGYPSSFILIIALLALAGIAALCPSITVQQELARPRSNVHFVCLTSIFLKFKLRHLNYFVCDLSPLKHHTLLLKLFRAQAYVSDFAKHFSLQMTPQTDSSTL